MERTTSRHVRVRSRRLKLVRGIGLIGLDTLLWVASVVIALAVRYEFDYSRVSFGGLVKVLASSIVAQIIWGVTIGLYPGRWELASFREAGAVGAGGILISVGLFWWLYSMPGGRPVPLSTAVTAPALFTVLALASRFMVRLSREVRAVSHHARPKRALLFGAGDAGHETIAALLRDRESQLSPVAFLDDDLAKYRLRIEGRRVVGGRNEIADAARDHDADTLIITMPSAPRAAVSEVARLARQSGLEVLILPRIARLLTTDVVASAIRPLSYADFLGRDPVRLDLARMERFVADRTVLITGAGGSIGSELALAIKRLGPKQMVLLDRDENALHALQLRLEGRALLDDNSLVVGDIRDPSRVAEVFAEHRPQLVFHAAALKHVTFLERFPAEAVKTNVLGTANVLESAVLHGVERFVNVSTDKAADPVSVLGLTKRIGEMLVAGHASNGMTAMSVRFGNVLGSSGSVIPTFRSQIERGGPLTVTHADATRYFMTIEEAAFLVVQAAALGRKGEVLVLDMGKPVRILDLARSLMEELTPGVEIPIEFTGLRPGEKLHETLVGAADRFTGSPHEGINAYAVPHLDAMALNGLAEAARGSTKDRLEKLLASAAAAYERV